MSTDEEFVELVKENFRGEFVAGSDEDVLHGFLAFSQAIECLSAKPVLTAMIERHPWFGEFWVNMEVGAGLPPDQQQALEQMQEFNKDAYKSLNEWLADGGLGKVRLWIYFSCHENFGHVTLNPEGESIAPEDI